jgi:hypothetical protein
MNDIRKTQALATWEKLFNQPEIRMDAEEQYEALLHLADEFGFNQSTRTRKAHRESNGPLRTIYRGYRRRHLALAQMSSLGPTKGSK